MAKAKPLYSQAKFRNLYKQLAAEHKAKSAYDRSRGTIQVKASASQTTISLPAAGAAYFYGADFGAITPPTNKTMTRDYYILDENGEVKITHEISEWGRFTEVRDIRQIAFDETAGGDQVSTVFLGLDHNFDDQGPPILFETMIFSGEHDGYQERYATREEALIGHARALDLATKNV
jgi:hypothetical protein